MAKILEKSGNFVSPEKWEPCTKLEFFTISRQHKNGSICFGHAVQN